MTMTTAEFINRLPAIPQQITLPRLVGTEKQIAWATKIRSEILRGLQGELLKNQDGSPTEAYRYMQSKELMMQFIDPENEPFPGLAERLLNSINLCAQKIERIREISQHEDAKFWIDNRTDGPKNHMNRTLKNYVQGK